MLSTLPPSLQLELMAKLREQKTYRNREEFSTRTGNPLGFSTFQMQQYLDTSAVRCGFIPGFVSPMLLSLGWFRRADLLSRTSLDTEAEIRRESSDARRSVAAVIPLRVCFL